MVDFCHQVQGFLGEIHYNWEWNSAREYSLGEWSRLYCACPWCFWKVESCYEVLKKPFRDLWQNWCHWLTSGCDGIESLQLWIGHNLCTGSSHHHSYLFHKGKEVFPVEVEHHLCCIFDLGFNSISKVLRQSWEGAYHSSAGGICIPLDGEVLLYQDYYSTHCLLHVRAALVSDLCHCLMGLHKESWPQNKMQNLVMKMMVVLDQHPFPSSPLVKIWCSK